MRATRSADERTPLRGGATEPTEDDWVEKLAKLCTVVNVVLMLTLMALCVAGIVEYFSDKASFISAFLNVYLFCLETTVLLTELGWGIEAVAPILLHWFPRGQLYILIGLTSSQAIASSSYMPIRLMGYPLCMTVVIVGIAYSLLGVCPCVQRVVERRRHAVRE